MEKEIFRYKDIIDNMIVIFLENKECWNNYIGRETKKDNKGHKSSYNTLNKEEYMDMIKMFKEYQNIYENKEKYRNIKIKNDNKSWKKIYKQNINYRCILFEEKGIKFILPFKAEIERMLNNG
ncbi:hypothetical protein C1646_759275 [Rhizophagus diaphanus]|nr:hypothetical protein C1646_759275 [Rhizophagus diaphanus] [Rhizophagus sp. MUCL 43196]